MLDTESQYLAVYTWGYPSCEGQGQYWHTELTLVSEGQSGTIASILQIPEMCRAYIKIDGCSVGRDNTLPHSTTTTWETGLGNTLIILVGFYEVFANLTQFARSLYKEIADKEERCHPMYAQKWCCGKKEQSSKNPTWQDHNLIHLNTSRSGSSSVDLPSLQVWQSCPAMP